MTERPTHRDLIRTVAERVIAHTDELTRLDQGDNMKRGFEAVLADLDAIAAKPLPDALKQVGMTLVMKVGGASGPLYGTLFSELGKAVDAEPNAGSLAEAFAAAVERVKARGKSETGQKTMLDVLVPVQAVISNGDLGRIRSTAVDSAAATVPMKAIRGRAAFLGDRSIGHMDPGARSSQLMIEAICDLMEAGR
jgi:phosphoenolpyruvate---glycerone phosphotransferase subunit DhaL